MNQYPVTVKFNWTKRPPCAILSTNSIVVPDKSLINNSMSQDISRV